MVIDLGLSNYAQIVKFYFNFIMDYFIDTDRFHCNIKNDLNSKLILFKIIKIRL